MDTQKARIVKSKNDLIVSSPYNPRLVEDIRGIPGRRYNSVNKTWIVHESFDPLVRAILRRFFQIEGEPSYVEYVVLRVRVTCEFLGSLRYSGDVSVDSQAIFDSTSGYLDLRPNPILEILDYAGGFVDRKSAHEPFKIDYSLRMCVLKDATWSVSGHASYEILSNDNLVDRFVDDILQKEQF